MKINRKPSEISVENIDTGYLFEHHNVIFLRAFSTRDELRGRVLGVALGNGEIIEFAVGLHVKPIVSEMNVI